MKKGVLILVGIYAAFLSLCFYRLTETPPTWMDEGVISQVAVNVAEQSVYGYQMAPGQMINAAFLTTSYPLIFPLALMFKIAGVGLYQARLVMIFYLVMLLVGSFYLVRRLMSADFSLIVATIVSGLLVTFAPLYGHGKNVLGEVPGLAWLVAGLYFLTFQNFSKPDWAKTVLTGLCLGFAMATKPIYLILLAPTIGLVIFIIGFRTYSWRQRGWLGLGLILPLVWWLNLHFVGSSIWEALGAGNPDHASVGELALTNLHRFGSELQPIYALGLVLVWGGVILWRRLKSQDSISLVEWLALSIALLDLISFLTTRGFYRYFLPEQILALIFLPISLFYLWSPKRLLLIGLFVTLIALQAYQTFFHSWIQEAGQSERATILSHELGKLPPNKSVLLYNIPEAMIFLPHNNYYQYFRFSEAVQRGQENLKLLSGGGVDLVVIDGKFLNQASTLLAHYQQKNKFDKYLMYEKK